MVEFMVFGMVFVPFFGGACLIYKIIETLDRRGFLK